MVSTQPGPASHRGPRAPRRTGRLVVVIVVVALLVAGGTAATIAAMRGGKAGATMSRDDIPQPSADAVTPAATPSSGDASPTPAPSATSDTALTSCRATVTTAEAVVAAARTGAKDWSIHTDARTEFLAHKITLAETNVRFTRTKLRGPSDQSAFNDALAAYERVATGCSGAASSSQPAAACATKAAALHTTVVAGQAVMKAWVSHLDNMALHAEDRMSATQARAAWIAAWKSAPTDLAKFSAADEASTNAPSCPLRVR